MNRTALIVVAALAAALLGLTQAAGAGNGPPAQKGSRQVETKPGKAPGESLVVQTTASDDAVAVTSAADLGKDASLVGSNGQTLSQALATAATIYYRTWSQRMESLLWGIAWNETHKGLFYFNGSAVWISSRYGWDTSGYHRCDYNSGFGFSISVKSCWKTGDPSWGTMTNGDQFVVSALYNGFPISATHEMRVCMNPAGSVWGC
jgi:hypothetical protein